MTQNTQSNTPTILFWIGLPIAIALGWYGGYLFGVWYWAQLILTPTE